MPHVKMSMRKAVVAANIWLDDIRDNPEKSEQIANATDLVELARVAGLDESSLDSVSHLHTEIQGLVLEALKQAVSNDREIFITWRHSVVQGVNISAPSPELSGAPLDIELQSGFYNDGISEDPRQQ